MNTKITSRRWPVYPVLALLPSVGLQAASSTEERPNILWLTFEDTSWYEFGCYGNKQVNTPNIDSLAHQGIQFMNAWSVAPQSSPARSSIITGCYATSYGMDVHPVSFDTPADIFFPELLREAGYYCTNNSKTHYNSTTDNKSCWDECTNKATYNSSQRRQGQPFFAVFNTVTSHMGRVRTFHTDGRRDYTIEGIYPEKLELPPHVPDLPEVRSDYAGHLEASQDVDKWVGFFLKDLKEKGLDQNTIIFVFSDHGGCLPRGKGYLFETGLRVPMIAYFPEKWKHLAADRSGRDSTLINFSDLAPSVLSIAGVRPPRRMQGKALLGEYAVKKQPNIQFAFATNQLHHFMPVRAAMDGRYKYMRCFIPHRQFALRNYYQWGMPSNKAWDKLVWGGHNTNVNWQKPFDHQPVEMLFDLANDPFELNNLADNDSYKSILMKFRSQLSDHIRKTKDLGFFLPSSRTSGVLYEDVRRSRFPLKDLYELAERAGKATLADLPLLRKNLNNKYPDMRFWAVVGMGHLALKGELKQTPADLKLLLCDLNPYVACEAAYALAHFPDSRNLAIARLVNPKNENDRKIGYSLLESLSFEPEMHSAIRKVLPELKFAAENLPNKANEDAGLIARGILVNLGELDIRDLHGEDSYQVGLKLNRGRRAMIPLPF